MNNLNNFSNQEDLWNALLSENAEIIISIQKILEPNEFKLIIDHLNKMATGNGWHPSQKKSASFALEILEKNE